MVKHVGESRECRIVKVQRALQRMLGQMGWEGAVRTEQAEKICCEARWTAILPKLESGQGAGRKLQTRLLTQADRIVSGPRRSTETWLVHVQRLELAQRLKEIDVMRLLLELRKERYSV
jgi:hypothetical protein